MEQHFSSSCRNFMAVSYNSGLADSWLVPFLGPRSQDSSFMIAAWNQFFPPYFEFICLFTLYYHKLWPTTFNKCIFKLHSFREWLFIYQEFYLCVKYSEKVKKRKKERPFDKGFPLNTDKLVRFNHVWFK